MTPRTLAEERYRMEGRLGHGGMATVFLAQDRKLDRPVAIKLLADNLAGDEEVRARFTREARLAAKLDHPNVVRVYDVGEEDDRPFIVMELVAGETLGDRLERRRSLPVSEAMPLLRQMCLGLGHAHAQRLVHRDVKPQNLLLREADDCLKVADFGIARAAEETRLTRTGKVIGTDPYMAPEQLADGRISPATDVFACGVVANEVLPERRPPELSEIVERCLEEDPRDRFTDASALATALASVDQDGATPATVPVAGLRSERRDAATRPVTASTSGVTRPTATRAEPAPEPRLSSRPTRVALLAAVLVSVVIAGAVALALSSGDSGSSGSSGEGSGGEPVQVEPAPRLDDPAAQARALADWLRARGR